MEQRREGYNLPAFKITFHVLKQISFNSFIVTNHVIVYKQKLVPIGSNTKWKHCPLIFALNKIFLNIFLRMLIFFSRNA